MTEVLAPANNAEMSIELPAENGGIVRFYERMLYYTNCRGNVLDNLRVTGGVAVSYKLMSFSVFCGRYRARQEETRGRDFVVQALRRPFPLAAGPLQSGVELIYRFFPVASQLQPRVSACRLQVQALDASIPPSTLFWAEPKTKKANASAFALRRGRDSNPRNLSVQQFSRLP